MVKRDNPGADMVRQQETANRSATSTPALSAESTTPKRSEGHAKIRVMVVGDSMSQGQEGDWTWRYRIWEWFRDHGVATEFVGPYVGTVQPGTTNPGPPQPPPLADSPHAPLAPLKVSGGYAAGVSRDFDSKHFALSGYKAEYANCLIKDVVSNYPADLMLLWLGFNDMAWNRGKLPPSDPIETLDLIHTLVTNARAAKPDIQFAIADVPQRSLLGACQDDLSRNTDRYNSLLRDAIPAWSTAQSPIHLVEVRKNYDCEVGSFDGLHPNALGEFQIARAFSLTLLNDFHLGKDPLKIPENIPSRPLPVPQNFRVTTSPRGVTAKWGAVYGAYGYDIRTRLQGATDWALGSASSNRWDSHWAPDGVTYDVQVRASAGNNTRKGDWTRVDTAVAHPQTAPAPQNVVVKATPTGFDLTFDPPTGPYTNSIIEYNILYWDKDIPGAYLSGAAFVDSPIHIDGLVPGHHYDVAPLTWNAAGEGFPGVVRSVTIGSQASQAADLDIKLSDAVTVHLSLATPSSPA